MSTFGKPRRAVVSYEQAHLRLKLWRGRPDSMLCIKCSETARHWAYMGGDPKELLRDRKGRAYSLDLDRYEPMCVPCHLRKDRADADGRSEDVCPRGHAWAENESIRIKRTRTTGLRFCLSCNRENSARYHERVRRAAQAVAS